MDVVADLDAPYPATLVWEVVSDLGTYPDWLDIVGKAVPAGDAAWTVDLRGKVGPFARSKRLRMVRTLAQAPNRVLFEREELDGVFMPHFHESPAVDEEMIDHQM